MTVTRLISEKEELKQIALLLKMTEVLSETLDKEEKEQLGVTNFIEEVLGYTGNTHDLIDTLAVHKTNYYTHREAKNIEGVLVELLGMNKLYSEEVPKYHKLIQVLVMLVRLFSANMELIKPKLTHIKEYTDKQMDAIILLKGMNIQLVYHSILANSELHQTLASDNILKGTQRIIDLLDSDEPVGVDRVLQDIDNIFEEVYAKMMKIVYVKETIKTNMIEVPISNN